MFQSLSPMCFALTEVTGRLMLTSNTYNQHFAPLSAEQLAENATKK